MSSSLFTHGRGRLSFAPLFLIAIAFVLAASATTRADEITLLEGERFTADVAAIDPDGVVQFAGDRPPLDLQALRRIDRPDVTTPEPDAAWSLPKVAAHKGEGDKRAIGVESLVHLAAGGEVRAANVTLDDGVASIDWAFGDDWPLPTAAVRAISFQSVAGTPMAEQAAVFDDAVNDIDARDDRLIAVAGDRLQPITGILRRITPEHVVFEWQGRARNVARSKVYGIVLAATGRTPGKLGRCHVHLTDGSSLWGRVIEMVGGELNHELLPAEEDAAREAVTVAVPWSNVHRLDVRSNRLVYLSDVQPLRNVQQPIVTVAMEYQRDRSVSGGPLKLAEQTFARGLGVHARSLLEYEAGGAFDVFAAVIGLDAAVGDKGDCKFIVLGDGRELFRKRMRGGDPPHELRVSIEGVDRLTLLVEPGEDLDLADHADWCEARMMRTNDADGG